MRPMLASRFRNRDGDDRPCVILRSSINFIWDAYPHAWTRRRPDIVRVGHRVVPPDRGDQALLLLLAAFGRSSATANSGSPCAVAADDRPHS